MKVILAGYAESKKILPAVSYLLNKNLVAPFREVGLGDYFSVRFLNYGDFTGKLFTGEYVKLSDAQESLAAWADDIRGYLESLKDDLVCFGLDDYLITKTIDVDRCRNLLSRVTESTACARLATSQFYRSREIDPLDYPYFRLNHTAEYSVTTQYSVWRRICLI